MIINKLIKETKYLNTLPIFKSRKNTVVLGESVNVRSTITTDSRYLNA